MFGLSILDIIVILGYFALIFYIGYWSMKRVKTQVDYYLGSRRFGSFVQIFAVFGTGTSADSPIGTARNTFRDGISGIWTVLNWLFTTPFNWIIYPWYRRMRMLTLADFWEERFQSKSLAGFYAIFGIIFFMAYISIGFTALNKTLIALTPIDKSDMTPAMVAEQGMFYELKALQAADYQSLNSGQKERLKELEALKPNANFSHLNPKITIITVAVVIIACAVAGGLVASFYADVVQGIFIILLSVIMLPFGLYRLGGFEGLHAKVNDFYFSLLGSPLASEFTWYYVVAISLLNLYGIVVQPQRMTMSGSAKNELSARIGGLAGNFIKRVVTLFWGMTGLVILALFAREISDPDLVWGYATHELLGGLGLGLVGFMIASLLAALMSSAQAYMISASALFVNNMYRPLVPDRHDGHYVTAGRIVGGLVVAGGTLIAVAYNDVFDQLKLSWELPIVFAAPFWLGMFWRKANRIGTMATVLVATILFFVLPLCIPVIVPGVRIACTQATREKVEVVAMAAKEADVNIRARQISEWDFLNTEGRAVGERPAAISVGNTIEKTFKSGGTALFFSQGLKKDRETEKLTGKGLFYFDLFLLYKAGVRLDALRPQELESVRLFIRMVLPLLLLFVMCLVTQKQDNRVLNQFYAKLRTPVSPDKEEDTRNVALAAESPEILEKAKMFPGTNLEFGRIDKVDVWGFLAGVAGVIIIIFLAFAMVRIGA